MTDPVLSEEKLAAYERRALDGDRRNATATFMPPKVALELIAGYRRSLEVEGLVEALEWIASGGGECALCKTPTLTGYVDCTCVNGIYQQHDLTDIAEAALANHRKGAAK